MKPRVLLVLTLMVSGSFSCASPPVLEATEPAETQALDSGPESPVGSVKRSKYETIVSGFDQARSAPDLSDFDPLDEPHPLTQCYSSRASDPELLSEMVIRQMSVSYSGTPSYGPLFPGVPDRIETSLVVGKSNGWVNSKNLPNEKRQVFETHPMGNTLVISILKNPFGIYQDFGNPAEIWLRKGRDRNIYFKVFRLDAEQNRSEALVGYCFKK